MGLLLSVLGIAVVGVGRWGSNIVRVVKELESEGIARLVAVVDVDESRVKEVASKYSIPNYLTDHFDLSKLNVSAAIISVPIDLLSRVAADVMSLGINVLIEKPVALRAEDVLKLKKIAEDVKIVAQPGFILRFDPVTHELKTLIHNYGIPKYMIFKRLSRRPPRFRKYSIVLDLMIHDVDLTRYLLGRKGFTVEHAFVKEVEDGVEQTVYAVIRYGEALITYVVDGNLPIKVREVEITFKDAYVKADYMKRLVVVRSKELDSTLRAEGEEPLKAEVRSFILRIKGVSLENLPTLNDAYEALRIIQEIRSRCVLNHKLNSIAK